MSASGLSPAQERARAAEAMAFQRANRPLSAGERVRAAEASHGRRVEAARRWVAEHLPECVDGAGGVCDFAVASAIRVRALRPDLPPDAALAAVVRVWREGWMRSLGVWEATA